LSETPEYTNIKIEELLNKFLNEDFQWVTIPFKIDGNATQKITIDDLQNMTIRYFYLTGTGKFSYECSFIEKHIKAKDYTGGTEKEIENEILGGGFIESPFFFRKTISDVIDIIVKDLSTAENTFKIEIFATQN
jgi:hypothetical protein